MYPWHLFCVARIDAPDCCMSIRASKNCCVQHAWTEVDIISIFRGCCNLLKTVKPYGIVANYLKIQFFHVSCLFPFCYVNNCINDAPIARTPAKVASNCFPDLFFARVRIACQKLCCRDYYPGGTEAALEGVMSQKRLLQGCESILFKPLHRDNFLSICFNCIHDARSYTLPIQENRASSTLSSSTAIFGALDTKLVSQDVKKLLVRFNSNRCLVSIQSERYLLFHLPLLHKAHAVLRALALKS